MLQPGIEYFGAADDDAAAAFADGVARDAVPLVRADDVGPDYPMAIFGALLTGRAISELAAEPELTTLSVEERGDSTIRVLRMPAAATSALSESTPEVLADIARRARVYPDLAPIPVEAIVDNRWAITMLGRA